MITRQQAVPVLSPARPTVHRARAAQNRGPADMSQKTLFPVCSPSAISKPAPNRADYADLQGFYLVGTAGFEPATARPPAGCATRLRHVPTWCKRATGIEPALGAWKAPVQPQHFARGYLMLPVRVHRIGLLSGRSGAVPGAWAPGI
jgi:hypothetical protein